MNKVIVTGGTGFIGSQLVKTILADKFSSVTIIANKSISPANKIKNQKEEQDSRLKLFVADIRDHDKILSIFEHEKPETCIHLAAKISVADSIKKPEETMNVNAKSTLNVLDACHSSGTNNFVFASSAAVYGNVNELPISEDRPLKPLSPYGASKMLAEQYVLSYKRSGKIKNAISLRIFNVYGIGQTSESDVITRFAKRLSIGHPPEINGNGTQTRDFISVEDVVDAFISSVTIMERGETQSPNVSPVFNIGTGRPTSIKDLALKMIEIFGHDLQPVYKERKVDEREIKFSYADITKAKEHLRYVAKKRIETGLMEMIRSMPPSNLSN